MRKIDQPWRIFFSLSQSVGVLGGRTRGARWFSGANLDGSTNEYVQTVQKKYPEAVPLQRMDPRMSLGFYCRNEADFDKLCHFLQDWHKLHPNIPQLFTIEDCMPKEKLMCPCLIGNE
jgi:hypothetical protein